MAGMQRVVLASRPKGQPGQENFRLEEADLPTPAEGEVLVRVIWLSLDPYMRGRMDDVKSYARPVEIGQTMEAAAVGEVIESRAPDFTPGDIVLGGFGWASHGVAPAAQLRRIDPSVAPIRTALGALGMPGHTAWVGLNDIAQAQTGETIVVSAATGAVGSMVGQLAKQKGMRVIGVAGGPEKCRFATEELKYDVCLDHRAGDADTLSRQIAEAAPAGVDVYYENVGGMTLEAVLPHMNIGGRIPLCGMIAWYSGKGLSEAMPLPRLWRTVLTRRLRVQGFIIFDHMHRLQPFLDEVAPMIADGQIIWRDSISEGLESAPEAFMRLLEGGNFGKQLVKLGDELA